MMAACTNGLTLPVIVPMLFNYEKLKSIKAYSDMLNEYYTPKPTQNADAWNEWGWNEFDERHTREVAG